MAFTAVASAQDIESKLSGNTASQGFTVKNFSGTSLFTIRGDGKTGLGTSTPTASFHVNGNDGLLATGALNSGTIPATGGGVRVMWYPKKAAFRAGTVAGGQWDDGNIGQGSFAAGESSIASGDYSTALGRQTVANNLSSTALGSSTTASGSGSTAFGIATTASSSGATAMGNLTTASGQNSTAMGYSTTASGGYALATGNHTTADAINTTAMGSYVSTAGFGGSFIIGDGSTVSTTNATAGNQMTTRFAGGYQFYTNSGATIGAKLSGNATSWSAISDRNAKENFRTVDFEKLLSKIHELPITEWNYKANDPSIRYIGPMAQDFYQSFHLGGTDSLYINSLVYDGINLAAIKGLEQRTEDLNAKTKEIAALREKVIRLETEMSELRTLKADLASLRKLIEEKTSDDGRLHTSIFVPQDNGEQK